MARPLRALRGRADDRPRRDRRQRCPAQYPERARLQPGGPRLGGQRLPDLLRRPAAPGWAARRLDLAPRCLPGRPRHLHRRLAVLRDRTDPGDADRRPLRAGGRRGDGHGGRARDDRDDVPGAARAGEGDRRLRLRRLRWRVDRPDRRRRAHPGDQLALDLLHQYPDRDRHGGDDPEAGRARRGDRLRPGRRRPRRGADHGLADARRLHDRRARRRPRLGRGPHHRAERRVVCAADRIPRARDDDRQPPGTRCGSSARGTCPGPTWSRR